MVEKADLITMAERADFIKIPETPGLPQTMPTEPEKRIASSDISVSLMKEDEAHIAAEGLYVAFPEVWWEKREPPSLRPPLHSTRVARLATRLRPSFSMPNVHWVKATYLPTGQIIGVAGWYGPGVPLHCIFRRSAVDFYGWKEQCGWSDEDVEEMWSGTNLEAWETEIEKNDALRKELLGDEPHWYLAPLLTWPEFQGRGVGKLLLNYAIEKADATDPITPLYLESASYARAVYMHCGFVPQSASNFLRRGPAIVRGLEAEAKEKMEDIKVEKVDIDVVANEVEQHRG